MRTLAVRERPRKLSEVIGNEGVIKALRNQNKRGVVPSCWLFVGTSGSGKTTIARIIAASLQEGGEFGEPSDESYEKTLTGEFEVHEVNASNCNKLEDIRELIDESSYMPLPPSKYRVIILDEAQRITSDGQKALLKVLEDGPEQTLWMFCTNEPGKILLTIKRRACTYKLEEFGGEEAKQLIRRVGRKHGLSKAQMIEFWKAAGDADLVTAGLLMAALESYINGMPVRQACAITGVEGNVGVVAREIVYGKWASAVAAMKGLANDELPPSQKVTHTIKLNMDQSRSIRAITAAMIKTELLKQSINQAKVENYIQALEVLQATAASYDESLLSSTIVGALANVYRILRRA